MYPGLLPWPGVLGGGASPCRWGRGARGGWGVGELVVVTIEMRLSYWGSTDLTVITGVVTSERRNDDK